MYHTTRHLISACSVCWDGQVAVDLHSVEHDVCIAKTGEFTLLGSAQMLPADGTFESTYVVINNRWFCIERPEPPRPFCTTSSPIADRRPA